MPHDYKIEGYKVGFVIYTSFKNYLPFFFLFKEDKESGD